MWHRLKKTKYRYFGLLIVVIASLLFSLCPNWPLRQEARATNFTIKTGYYIGNGATRSITGLGFQPNIVFIKADTNNGQAILKTSDMSGDSTAYLAAATANFTGGVTSLDSDGFSLGTNANVNAASVIYQWVAIRTTGASDVMVGTYTGNGSDNRDIAGIGFQPDMVIVKGNTTQLGVWKSSSMTGEKNEYFSGTAELATDGIQAFGADGFQVGTHATVNSNTVVYYYVAVKNVAGIFNVGTYTGNNTDNRNITGVGFKPNFVFVKQASTQVAIMRTDTEYGDKSLAMTATAHAADQIQSFSTDGFQIGVTNVNTNSTVYYYAAFGGYAPVYSETYQIKTGSYAGNGVNPRSVTGIGFKPDLVIIKNQSSYGSSVFGTSFFPKSISYFIASAYGSTGILSYDSDGFTIDGSNAVNGFVYGYDYIAIKGINSANFRIGVYTGDGLDNRQITGLGFQPDCVILKSITSGVAPAVFRTSSMSGDVSSSFNAEANGNNRIQQFLADGFEIGNDYRINVSGQTIVFIAFQNTASQFKVGTYTGNGADNRDITGVGFRSNWLFTKATTAVLAAQRYDTYQGDIASKFDATTYGANIIQSLSNDGFQIGTDGTVNTNAVVYNYVAFGGYTATTPSGDFLINTGSYYGDGTTTRSISDVGFQPDWLFIKSDSAASAFFFGPKDLATSGYMMQLSSTGTSNTLASFTTTGFQFKNNNLNAAKVIYQWIAFKENNSANMKIGFYTGNAADNREITGVGFQPDLVITKTLGQAAVWRNSSMAGDTSYYFSNTAAAANMIQALSSDGFQVGTGAGSNSSNVVYFYAAFKNKDELVQTGTYTGNGSDNRSITGVGFKPEFMFTAASGVNPVFKTDKYNSEASGLFGASAIFVNALQTFESDGFQVGSDATVNTNATVYYYSAFKGVPAVTTPSGSFLMQVGNYTGTGSTLSISALDFKPNLLFIKSDTNAGAIVAAVSALPGSNSMLLNDNGGNPISGGVTSLDSNGFTLGTNANVNSSGVTYRFIAFGNSGSADFKVGYYSGVGSDNYSIAGLGFQPDFVVIKSVGQYAVWRSSAMAGDLAGFFTNVAEAANMIQALEADGFQLGTSSYSNAAGAAYWYVAFKAGSGKMSVGNYTGNASDNRSISGVGFSPDWLMIKNSGAVYGTHRSSDLIGDNSQHFVATANLADAIQALETDGFQVGTNAVVNTNAQIYRYVAWNMPPPNMFQTSYRWRMDDGGETNASWAEATDTGLTQLAVNTRRRLRLQVQNDGGSGAGYTYRLEYGEKATTCAAISSWTTVPNSAGSEAWVMSASDNITNTAATTNSSEVADPSGSTFVAGAIHDTTNQTASIYLTGTQFTEIEYSLEATSNAVSGATYCFRLTNAGSTTNLNYDLYPEASISSAIAISLTTSGAVDFGTIALGATVTTSSPEVIQVDAGPADLDIKSTDFIGATTGLWELSTSSGSEMVQWEYSNDNTNWSSLSVVDTLYSLATNVSTSDTRNLYLRLTLPSATTLFEEYSADVTIIASAP